MNTIDKTLIDEFTSAFEQLRSLAHNPDMLADQGTLDANLRALARNARTAARPIEIQINAGKIHPDIEKSFVEIWRDWRAGWRIAVLYLVGEDSVFDRSYWPKWTDFKRRYRSGLREPDVCIEDGPWEFDPTKHEGGKLLGEMLELNERELEEAVEILITRSAGDQPENEELDEHTEVELVQRRDILLKGLSVTSYLEKQMGFDFQGIFERWKKVPPFLVPLHVKTSTATPANGRLFDLLNDAIRAYVAGAPAAAMAICRSALEVVVKEHYLKGNSDQNWDLHEGINLAAARYEFLDKERMHKHRRRANEVLHSYTTSRSVNESDPVLPFICDLRYWIEKAPERHGQ